MSRSPLNDLEAYWRQCPRFCTAMVTISRSALSPSGANLSNAPSRRTAAFTTSRLLLQTSST
eukprot:3072699-Amphidinium_carterae.1